jgi:spermidine/putrescine transport system substrate-binding protein
MKSKLMTLAAVGVLALGAGGCGADVKKDEGASSGADAKESTAPAPKTESGTLVISNWDAYLPKNLIPDFEKETGIKVKLAKHTTNEDIMGKLDAAGGKGYDLVFVSGQFAEALDKRGWAAPVDPAKVPNLSNLYPEAQKLGYDPGNKYSVPYTWGTTGICYRSDKVEGTPTSWNDLLKPKGDLKGKVTMLDTDRWLMLPALKVLGFSANTTDEGELKQARDLLLETKDDLLAYDSTTFYSKLVSGEAHLVEAWDGWCNYGMPEEGSDLWVDTMVVLKSSKNQDAAHKFLDFVLRPETGEAVVNLVSYKVPNAKAMEKLPEKLVKQFPNLAMSPAELLKGESLQDLGKAQPAWSRTVTEITS